MPRYTVAAPASSSNLGPGFDTLGLAVTLHLTADVTSDAGFQVELSGEGRDILPANGRNWVLKGAREIAGDAVDRAHWRLHSDIPVSRGLGSSAAARAAGLAAGYLLHDGRLPPRHELFAGVVRTENHPDNASATIFGGFRVAGREGHQAWQSWPGVLPQPSPRLLLVIPELPVSTQQARSILPTSFARAASVGNLQALATMLSGLARGDWDAVRRGCRDHLHESYRLPLVPGLALALAELRAHSSTGGAWLSGAGPCLAAFLPDADSGTDIADGALAALRAAGTAGSARLVEVAPDGLQCEERDE